MIELSFGLVSGVGPSIDVLDGGPRASREGDVSGIFRHLHWRIYALCERLLVVPVFVADTILGMTVAPRFHH